MSFEQRKSADNAIWLCADHARLVDTNAGNQYPASLLQSWKDLHEAFSRLEIGGHPRPFGWVESLKLDRAPATLAGREFYFSARNLIVGANMSGKTLLSNIIAGIGKPSLLARASRSCEVNGTVRWHDPHPHDLAFAAINGQVSHELDGRRVPYVGRPYRTVLLSGEDTRRVRTLDDLARAIDADPVTVANVLPELPATVDGTVKEVRIDENSVELKLSDGPLGWIKLSDMANAPAKVSCSLVLEIAIAFAQVQAEVEPTLLVMDEIMGAIDQAGVRSIYSFLARNTYSFQVVMATVFDPPDDCKSEWLLTKFSRDDVLRSYQSGNH